LRTGMRYAVAWFVQSFQMRHPSCKVNFTTPGVVRSIGACIRMILLRRKGYRHGLGFL
jgi:hypothetical protein